MKGTQTLLIAFSFISHLLQCSPTYSVHFCGQYVTSGALSIDYMNYVFSPAIMYSRDTPVNEIIQILASIANCSQSYINVLEGSLAQEMLLKSYNLSIKSVKENCMKLCATLCKYDDKFVKVVAPFVKIAGDELQKQQSDSEMLIQCVHLMLNVTLYSDYHLKHLF